MLSAKELFKYRNALEKTLPVRGAGTKEYKPDGSWLQNKCIENFHEERERVLSEPRVVRSCDLVKGEWKPDVGLLELVQEMKNFWEHMGFVDKQRKWLYPEEALFLLEAGILEMWYQGLPMSIQEAYTLLLEETIQLEFYQVYTHLRRIGYVVLRHQGRYQFTKYERQIGLDKHVSHKKLRKDAARNGSAQCGKTSTQSDDSTRNKIDNQSDGDTSGGNFVNQSDNGANRDETGNQSDSNAIRNETKDHTNIKIETDHSIDSGDHLDMEGSEKKAVSLDKYENDTVEMAPNKDAEIAESCKLVNETSEMDVYELNIALDNDRENVLSTLSKEINHPNDLANDTDQGEDDSVRNNSNHASCSEQVSDTRLHQQHNKSSDDDRECVPWPAQLNSSDWNFDEIIFPNFKNNSESVLINKPDSAYIPQGPDLDFLSSEYIYCKKEYINTKKQRKKDQFLDKMLEQELEFSHPEIMTGWHRVKKSCRNWKEYKMAVEQGKASQDRSKVFPHLYGDKVEPLVKPELARSTCAVLEQLQVVEDDVLYRKKCVTKPETLPDFDVYAPNSKYKKTKPGIPDFRVKVSRSCETLPDLRAVSSIDEYLDDEASLHWAMVDNGIIAFYCMSGMELPQEISLG